MAVYVIGPDGGPYKIGTSRNSKSRMSSLQTSSPVELFLIKEYAGGMELEKHLHEAFAGCRIRGEWFKLTGDDFIELEKIVEKYGDYKALTEEQKYQVTIRKLFVGKDCVTSKTINQLPSGDYRKHGGAIWGWYRVSGCLSCISPQKFSNDYYGWNRDAHEFSHIELIFEENGQLYKQTALVPIDDPEKANKNRLTEKQIQDVLQAGQIFL